MAEPVGEKPCIEIEYLPMHTKEAFTVAYYDSRLRFSRCIAYHALPFHEITWTLGAPPVERLTTEWQEGDRARFRISDPEVYDQQMRQLVGLA